MADRFAGIPCVLCGNTSRGVGEHVWPSWLIEDFHGEGPFSTNKGGIPYQKRDGTATSWPALPSIHVPMCEPCNTLLSHTIEAPAKEILERLIPWSTPHPWPVIDSIEAAALARWFLKVGLLSAHPDAVHDLPQLNADPDFPRFSLVEPEWLEWMRTATAPPAGFSVYVTRRLVTGEQPQPHQKQWIVLPRIAVNEKNLAYMTRSFGLRGLNVTIVWHPGWPIRHPQVENGRAAALWPSPSRVDFASIPDAHPKEFRFIDAAISEMSLTAAEFDRLTKSPLVVDVDPISAFLGLFDGPAEEEPS